MKPFDLEIDALTGEEYYRVHLRGRDLLSHPLLNKGSCFSREERKVLGLLGHLPYGVSSVADQVARSLEAYQRKSDDLERYIFLLELLNRNETLFYKLLSENLREMLPIVYTPTVGLACQNMSHILRRSRGVYIHPENINNIDEILGNVSQPQVDLIVVTDGERILGLGDLGTDGMGIPVGKVNLYVAAGGLHPACCLAVCLDVGTNNDKMLKDPLYMGYRHPRLDGQAYFDFIEQFVVGVKRSFPRALLQWEDFAKHKAFKLLDRYRDRILSFNDDIQGTGATASAALMTAVRLKGSTWRDQRIAILGMGQAGTGISNSVAAIMREQGLSDAEIRARFFAMDVQGLLFEDDPKLEDHQRFYAHARGDVADWSLQSPDRITLFDVIKNARPTILIGVTAQTGAFDESILRQMAENDPRPVIMALSNPTHKSECTPQDVMKYTGGRGLVATGSPFPPVVVDGREHMTSQCNNLFVFPGVGLGALLSGAQKVTDGMFIAASKALSQMVTHEQTDRGLLLPVMQDVRKAGFEVAKAVAIEARDTGLGRQMDDKSVAAQVAKAQWEPHFYAYRAG